MQPPLKSIKAYYNVCVNIVTCNFLELFMFKRKAKILNFKVKHLLLMMFKIEDIIL